MTTLPLRRGQPSEITQPCYTGRMSNYPIPRTCCEDTNFDGVTHNNVFRNGRWYTHEEWEAHLAEHDCLQPA